MKTRAKNYTLVVYPEDLSTEMQTNGAWIDFRELVINPCSKSISRQGILMPMVLRKPHYHAALLQGGRKLPTFAELKRMI